MMTTYEKRLEARGLRLASQDEPGWADRYVDEDGEIRSAWITELPDGPGVGK